MSDLQELTDELLNDPEFKKEYEALKSDKFDYTEWKKENIDNKSREQIDEEIDTFFSQNSYSGNAEVI